jgi:uncharacterized membrane protein YeiH
MLTGIGGGIARDVLLSNVPAVFRSDIYAVAALAGAAVVVIGDALHLPTTATALLGAALCFGLRMLAVRFDWHLPRARVPDQTGVQREVDERDDNR